MCAQNENKTKRMKKHQIDETIIGFHVTEWQ